MFKRLLPFIFIVLQSCGQDLKKHKADPNVSRLAKKIIPLVSFLDNPDSCRKALLFLDSATSIDSKCFSCFENKIMFLASLKKYDRAIFTNDTLIAMRPNAHDLYLKGGILCELNEDTIASKKYFQKSLAICNSVLDTMNKSNRDYVMIVSNAAVDLIMLDNKDKANIMLKSLYDSQPDDPEYDNVIKKSLLSLINKDKTELRESWLNAQNSR